MKERIYKVKVEVWEYPDTEVELPELIRTLSSESGDIGWIRDQATKLIDEAMKDHKETNHA